MANHLQPTTSSLYTDFLAQLMARIDDSVKMLDSVDTAPTGIPVAAIRRNGLNVERWSGTAWAAVARMLSTDNAAALTALGVSAFIRQLLDDADAAAARATLGAQASDATLTALAAITTAANKLIYATGSDAFSTTDFTAFARTLLDDADAAAARTTLGLTIGTNVQAYDATLAALAGLALAADKMIYATGADQVATTTLTAFARTLLDDADATAARATLGVSDAVGDLCKTITDWNNATTNGWYMGEGAANSPTADTWYMGTVICHNAIWATQFVHEFSSDSVSPNAGKRYWRSKDNGVWTGWVSDNIPYTTAFARTLLDDADAATARTTLGLTIGTNVQAYDATLAALAGLALAADKMIYATGADQVATTDLTAFARTLLDDADAAAARTTLGVSGAVDNYCKTITDWDNATTNGWYMGSGAANAPTAGAWYMGTAICHNPTWTTQFIHEFSTDSVGPNAGKRYWRSQNNGVWTEWVSDNIPYTTAFARTLLDDADATAARATLGAAALASFAGANSGNGYRKIPMSGGADLIIQWGSGTGVNITFPISFASACYAVTPVCIDGNQATVNLSVLPSTTGFSVKKYYVNTQLDSLAFNWIAVGV